MMIARFSARRLTLAAVLVAAVLAALAPFALDAKVQLPPAEPLLLTGARILDARAGRYVPAPAVLIVGDRIEGISSAPPATLPAGTRRIDLTGATLVPGLGDMFATASPDGSADADFYYSMALAHGVTQFRAVGAKLPWAASQRERARTREIVAPRLSIGGPRLDQVAAMSFTARAVPDAQAARREVAAQASLGADWISVGTTTTPDIHRAIVRAAHASKLRVSGEPGATTVTELVTSGVDAIDRLGFFTRSVGDREKELRGRPDFPTDGRDAVVDYLWQHATAGDLRADLAKTLRSQVTVIPLLASFNGTLDAEGLQADPAVALLPARVRDGLLARAHPGGWPRAAAARQAAEARSNMVRALEAAGVRLATGVDAESNGYNIPGAGVHRELALLVAAGLTPAQALRAATINCAEMLGTSTTLGQIKSGYKADLFVVDGDPLAKIEDLRRIRLVVRGGEALDPAALIAQARRAAR